MRGNSSNRFVRRALYLGSVWLLCACSVPQPAAPLAEYSVEASPQGLILSTSDSLLAARFKWAVHQALSYVHDGDDPVGKWYEAALPNREAFCMRDVSHQSVGAHYLGLSEHTKNMLIKFADNIEISRDWCSYWEINRYDKPAPVDYANDDEFWYNLPANFDVLNACWKQYNLTADRDYLEDASFVNFYQRSMTDYVKTWDLGVNELMQRDRFMNLRSPLDSTNSFHYSRGLPSYGEGDPLQLYLGGDLICMEFQAFTSFGNILKVQGRDSETATIFEQARQIGEFFNDVWWDSTENQYHSALLTNGEFVSKPNRYLLLSGICQTLQQHRSALARLLDQKNLNIESQSYLPHIFYREDEEKRAYQEIMDLSDPLKERKEYPEVSFALVEAVMEGMLGISSDAVTRTIFTLPRLTEQTAWVSVQNVPMFEGSINLSHQDNNQSTMENLTDSPITWVARLPAGVESLAVDGMSRTSRVGVMPSGKEITQVEYILNPGEKVTISIP
ncbi:MAG: hypothetical protein OER04_16105 [Cyclobacteriaceae bacterium]|nr:hypothetical protein [Cyclobacteriaceae bacterium]